LGQGVANSLLGVYKYPLWKSIFPIRHAGRVHRTHWPDHAAECCRPVRLVAGDAGQDRPTLLIYLLPALVAVFLIPMLIYRLSALIVQAMR